MTRWSGSKHLYVRYISERSLLCVVPTAFSEENGSRKLVYSRKAFSARRYGSIENAMTEAILWRDKNKLDGWRYDGTWANAHNKKRDSAKVRKRGGDLPVNCYDTLRKNGQMSIRVSVYHDKTYYSKSFYYPKSRTREEAVALAIAQKAVFIGRINE